ncbi:MAG: PIN domain-containing protein [Gammaproteobacteria bacterium]|nr:PIN domain-containing protein [Gammaproteobacteria bacterium]
MPARAFVDTNTLLYAASTAPNERRKRERARVLLGAGDYGLSAQVLQEFYVNVTRSPQPAMSHAAAAAAIRELSRGPAVPIGSALVSSALRLRDRYRISYWDAAIVAAAIELKAKVLYSKDLNDGQRYGEVVVENPFTSAT